MTSLLPSCLAILIFCLSLPENDIITCFHFWLRLDQLRPVLVLDSGKQVQVTEATKLSCSLLELSLVQTQAGHPVLDNPGQIGLCTMYLFTAPLIGQQLTPGLVLDFWIFGE
jgi:hypothetical protein